MVSFLDYEGTDPTSSAREAAGAFTEARKEVEASGIKSFLFNSASPEEFDQRIAIREVSGRLDEVADKYLGSREDGALKLASSLREEFVAQVSDSTDGTCPNCLGYGNIRGEECESCHGSGKEDWYRSSKVAEKEIIHLDSGDVEIEKGKLTKQVGGKPSEHMDKVRELAEKGNKGAQFYLNVLSSRCSMCGFKIASLRDEDSYKEAALSGMCQNCQDDYFGTKTAHYGPLGHDCFDCGSWESGVDGGHRGLSGGNPPRYICQDCGAGNCGVHVGECDECGGDDEYCDSCGGTGQVCGYCGGSVEDQNERWSPMTDNELIEHSLKHGVGELPDGTWGQGGTAPSGSIAGSPCNECDGTGKCSCVDGIDNNLGKGLFRIDHTDHMRNMQEGKGPSHGENFYSKTQPVGSPEPSCEYCNGDGVCFDCEGSGKTAEEDY